MKAGTFTKYYRTTREPYVAALLVFPVYLLYQVGLSITTGLQNGADYVTYLLLLLRSYRPEALWGLGAAAVIGYGVLLWQLRRRKRFSLSLFGLVALEGALLGLVMLLVINRLMQALLMGGGAGDYPFQVDLVLSLGAGFHEELVFRVLLFGGAVWLGRKLFKVEGVWLVIVAALVSSTLFSAVHHLGPLGEPFTFASFLFRFFAGCYFATVYKLRGFAVAVYTHAIYDIGVFAVT